MIDDRFIDVYVVMIMKYDEDQIDDVDDGDDDDDDDEDDQKVYLMII